MTRLAQLGAPIAILAFLLAGFLRLYDLEHNPPGLWQDEASTGVDAYLLWHTGKDRAGAHLPLISRSFGDYPFALYRYLDAPIVGLLDPSPGKERIVAALLSFGIVITLVIVMRRRFGPAFAIGALMSAAICPNWILLARYGSEQILLPATLTVGLALFELGKDSTRRKHLWLGAFVLGLAAYSYHAAKVLLPLWMLGFLVYHAPTIRALWPKEKRHLIGPIVIFALMVLPSVYLATTPEGNARAKDAAVFYRKHGLELLGHVVMMWGHFLRPDILFTTGPNALVLSPPGLGLWSWVDAILVPLGFGAALLGLRGHPHRRLALFFLYWFVVGPAPASLGYEENSVTRLVGWYPAPQALAGLAVGWLATTTALEQRVRAGALAIIGALWIVASVRVVDRLMIQYPKLAQREWQYEISATIRCAKEAAASRQPRPHIVVSPGFTYAETFAQFWLLPLPKLDGGRAAFSVEKRASLAPGELYAAPGGEKLEADAICEIRYTGRDEVVGRVWAR